MRLFESLARSVGRISIRWKSIVVFVSLLLVVSGAGFQFIGQLGMVANAGRTINASWLPSLQLASEVIEAMNDYRQTEAALFLAMEDESVSDTRRDLALLVNQIQSAENALRKLPTTPEEDGYIADFDIAWKSYLELSRRVVDLVEVSKTDEASRLLTGDAAYQFTTAKTFIGRLEVAKVKGSNDAAVEAEGIYQTTIHLMRGTILFVVLLCSGAAAFVVLGVVRPLNRMTLVVGRMAEGRLDSAASDIPGFSRRDEFGALSRALLVLQEAARARLRLEQEAADARLAANLQRIEVENLHGQHLLSEARAARAEAEAARRGAEAELAQAIERERADRMLGVQNVRFRAALSSMSQALCMFDKAGTLVVANNRLAEMFGLPQHAVKSDTSLEALLLQAAGASNLGAEELDSMLTNLARLRAGGTRSAHERELADGRTLAVNFAPVVDDGWLVTFEDISERRRVEAKMIHMAHHDALTGLPNRVLFHDRLSEAVARARRGEPCAVLYLDLDHFKAVNDTLGHPIGDALLRAVTSRLQNQVRETDTVARLGGDEFAVVQLSVDQPGDATSLARRLIEALSAPYELEGQQVIIGTSVGISVVPTDGLNPDELLKNADLALYRAKADGRGLYRFFEPEMDAIMQARRMMEIDLRKALGAGEFEVFYQPLINLRTRAVVGFEALLRWFHPERGLIQPADFIPLAEEIGLIVGLGEWVLCQACRDAATWPHDMKVAVNLSPGQFASRTLVEAVAAALDTSGLRPEQLELEITETLMLNDTEATLVILHQLRKLGVSIAMDDFGTGYSSLSYLRRFPFSRVKIDGSFIAGLGSGGDCDAIVAAVTGLCTTLGMTTTAEGVETEEQLQQLLAGNCNDAQGYLFGRPRPAAEVASVCAAFSAPVMAENGISG